MNEPWRWDETLFEGSAPYYAGGRFPYPAELAHALRDELALDGTGRLLDVGCGPGSLTLLLAPLFAQVAGVDADAAMLAEARRRAAEQRVTNADWVHVRAEELPPGLGTFDVATFAQSFHWMDRPRVASIVREMLAPTGVWVHVNAWTHQGAGDHAGLPAPPPPHDRIAELVKSYLGPVRRAGRGTLPDGPPGNEEQIMVEAGFRGPTRLAAGGGRVLGRTEDEVVASVYSRTGSAPHLFGARLPEFESDLRALLRGTASDGRFCEREREIELVIWRR